MLKMVWSRANLEAAALLETMLSVLPMYLFSEIQSIFLKDLGLRFLMYKSENLCLHRFFLTTQKKPLEICFLKAERRSTVIMSAAR